MNINKIGLALVGAFSVWCVYHAVSDPADWNDCMIPATLAVLVGGVFAFNLGRDSSD